jgi:hypothetical protein
MPYTDIADPNRTKLLSATDEPTFKKSKIDSEEPSLVHPYMETDDPRRAKDLMESEEPKCKKSSTDSDAPKRDRP